MPDHAPCDPEPEQQQHPGSEPQPRGARVEIRPEQDEVAVTCTQVVAHLLIRLAGQQQFSDLASQVAGETDRRIRDGLVLALHAPQLMGEAAVALLQCRILELDRIDGPSDRRAREATHERQHEHRERTERHRPTHDAHPPTGAEGTGNNDGAAGAPADRGIRDRKSSDHTSRVIAPTCRCRTIP